MKELIEPWPSRRRDVRAFFTTKKIGVDRPRLLSEAGLADKEVYLPIQRHTDDVMVLRHDTGRRVADAVLTKRSGVIIGVSVADCVPILVYDRVRRICGAVHAGWRGTAKGIIRRVLDIMIDEMYSVPSDIVIATGPSIRWCCYTVGDEVLSAVKSMTGDGEYYEKRSGKICLDIPSANRLQAMGKGIPEENIWSSDECTYCHPERFFSYRYAKGPTGRQGGFIGMLD